MALRLEEKVIVVSGGAGLIGRAFCRDLASEGAMTIIADLDIDAANRLKEDILNDDANARVAVQAMDITKKASVAQCIDEVHGQWGRIDAVVNNAYPRNENYGRHFFEVEYSDLCENINIHLGGYFQVAQLFAQYFKKQQAGVIVNMASIYGFVAPKFDIYRETEMTTPVEYALIKAGVIQLSKYLAAYLKGTGIRVNTISPGGILDAQPEPFLSAYREQCANIGMLDTRDISATLVHILSDDARAINGQNIVIDDAFSN